MLDRFTVIYVFYKRRIRNTNKNVYKEMKASDWLILNHNWDKTFFEKL